MKLNIIEKTRQIITEPKSFFAKLKDGGILNAVIFYAIFTGINVVGSVIVGMLLHTLVGALIVSFDPTQALGETIGGVFSSIMGIIGYPFRVAWSFAVAGILFAWLYIWGGRASYDKTYQLFVYSSIPHLALGWIPIIGFFAWIYSVVLTILGVSKVYKMSTMKSTLLIVLPIAVIMLFLLMMVVIGFMALGGISILHAMQRS